MAGKNYLEMSDEDFSNLPEYATGVAEEAAPAVVEEPAVVVTEETTPVVTEVIDPPKVDDPAPVVEKTDAEIAAELATKEEPKPQETEEEKKVREEKEAAAAAELTPEQKAVADKAAEDAAKSGEAPDYEGFYKAIIATPIKAGKKTIEVKTPEEAIKLMQMGAGFGRKMQEIQPHLKTLRFMEANNLLNVDQAELAYLVDLKNRNPDAIRKLVKESGIDPIDFANDDPVTYKSNIPAVTDEEVSFRDALSDIASQEGGLETISVIEKTWDPKSHEALMKEPGLLSVIQAQREVGVYDRIVAEVDRQRAFGNIPASTPFLQAYQQVGNHLRDTNGFADLVDKVRQAEPVPGAKPAPVVSPQIIATKVSAPKSSVSNNDKANAAAATKNTPKAAKTTVNVLAMSDEDFAKQFANI